MVVFIYHIERLTEAIRNLHGISGTHVDIEIHFVFLMVLANCVIHFVIVIKAFLELIACVNGLPCPSMGHYRSTGRFFLLTNGVVHKSFSFLPEFLRIFVCFSFRHFLLLILLVI